MRNVLMLLLGCVAAAMGPTDLVWSQEKLVASPPIVLGPYAYESKPADPELEKFHPMLAPQPGPMMLRQGDRLAILGDSITQQVMYSRLIEMYLTLCHPELDISVRQYGWSGEKTDGMLRRLDQDVLRFDPTVATLSYGMNDARYRPFDQTNGRWYRDHYTAIVRKLKAAGARVVLGSPGCSGKIASWVKSRNGTLDEHNLNLCALRDIGIEIAEAEQVRFADVFWPMYKAQIATSKKYAGADPPYEVAGRDGIHPGWAGHVMMAYAYLHATGIDGNIGSFTMDFGTGKADASDGHTVDDAGPGKMTITSRRHPLCPEGKLDDSNSMRSGMTLVPFFEDLNRFTLVVTSLPSGSAKVSWGDQSQTFTADQLAKGINLVQEFTNNPFSEVFRKTDEAVTQKQRYETEQVKNIFHGKEGREDFEAAVKRTEAVRAPLVQAISDAIVPVTHTIVVTPIEDPASDQ
ncbi:SGNH/GDSL hydrolase family protein [Rubripirellula lacrimiformis]|nr:SGNH/GDSL hydrolase family protein [Rubripirellula lacrimiformis]